MGKPIDREGIIKELRRCRSEIEAGDDETLRHLRAYANLLVTMAGVRVSMIGDLLEMIQDRAYRTVRRELIKALGNLKTRRHQSIPVLTSLLDDHEVACAALDVLAELKAEEEEEAIRGACASSDPAVRFTAHRALRRIGLEPGASEAVLEPWRDITPYMTDIPHLRAIPMYIFEVEPTLRHIFGLGDCQNASLDDLHHLVYNIGEIRRTLRVRIFGFRFTYKGVPDIPLFVQAMRLNDDDWVLRLYTIPPLLGGIDELPIPRAIPTSDAIPDGATSFHLACMRGQLSDVEAELATNPKAVNEAETENGNSPLMLAAYYWHADIVAHLLRHGADVSQRAGLGQTALHQAAMGGSRETVQLLLDAGAEIDAECGHGTALMFAASIGNFEAVQTLLAAGASTEAEVEGITALDIAIESQSTATAALIREAAARS